MAGAIFRPLMRMAAQSWRIFVYVVKLKFLKGIIDFYTTILWLMLKQHKSEKIAYNEEAAEKGNDYIDKILKGMFEERLDEYDPYRIEDSVIGFSRKIAFVDVSGEAKLHDGYINGLKTLHRQQHCSLERENERLRVKANLGAGELNFHYSGSIKFMTYGHTINVLGSLGYVEVHIEFTVDSETGRNGKLDMFIIDDMRGISIKITGLGPLNWVLNLIVGAVTKVFRRFLRNFLQIIVVKHISENIRNFPFPVTKMETPKVPEAEPKVPEAEPKVPEAESTETNEPPQVAKSNETNELPQVVEVAEVVVETDADNRVEKTGLPEASESLTENILSTSDIKYADED